MTFEEYCCLDGIGLASLVRSGELAPDEPARIAIEAIERLNPSINAVVMTSFERGLATPANPGSPLSGVPFLLKDVNLYSEDMPTTFSSRFFRDAKPKSDSTLVRRWRAAGLPILGKTNTPEFAAEFVTEPAFRGTSYNPWDRGRTVGGSSGGAGAAVASGMVPIAHATDLGGSIRVPAACCGLYGFKPSVGLNPLGPHSEEIASGLDSDHVVTRSVRDSAASLDVTAEQTRNGKPADQPSFLDLLERELPQLRIGVCDTSPSGVRAGADQRAAIENVAALLSNRGHAVSRYSYPEESAAAGAWFDVLWLIDVQHLVAEHAAETGRQPGPDELEPITRHALAWIGRLGAADLYHARRSRNRAAQSLLGSMAELDIVLTPAIATDPVPLGALSFQNARDIDEWNSKGYTFAPFSAPANIAGQPAASCPVAMTEAGLPLAIQIAGHPGADHLVLRLSRLLEQEMPWEDRISATALNAWRQAGG